MNGGWICRGVGLGETNLFFFYLGKRRYRCIFRESSFAFSPTKDRKLLNGRNIAGKNIFISSVWDFTFLSRPNSLGSPISISISSAKLDISQNYTISHAVSGQLKIWNNGSLFWGWFLRKIAAVGLVKSFFLGGQGGVNETKNLEHETVQTFFTRAGHIRHKKGVSKM